MRKIQFAPGEYYHIFNHGVDEKNVFSNENDFMRFLAGMIIFNDENNSLHNLTHFVKDNAFLTKSSFFENRKPLTEIISFTLLPTHYHFFIREKTENGISRFMHRLNKGYARYFNLVNNRKGSLWQGTFEAKHIENESYFIHIISYIHLNILDLYFPAWREGKLGGEEWVQATLKLIDYPWSSYGFYRTGIAKIPFTKEILTLPEWLEQYYPQPESFESNLHNWSSRLLEFNE